MQQTQTNNVFYSCCSWANIGAKCCHTYQARKLQMYISHSVSVICSNKYLGPTNVLCEKTRHVKSKSANRNSFSQHKRSSQRIVNIYFRTSRATTQPVIKTYSHNNTYCHNITYSHNNPHSHNNLLWQQKQQQRFSGYVKQCSRMIYIQLALLVLFTSASYNMWSFFTCQKRNSLLCQMHQCF